MPMTPLSEQQNHRLLRLATYASVFTACLLIVIKLVATMHTGSVSILASLVDSLMDSLASIINLLAVRYALMPPDQDHRFGHGKAEPLAGMAQAGFICASAFFLVFHAIDRLLNPQPLSDLNLGVGVMLFSILATALLLAFQRYVVKKTQSTAIKADALHYLSDLLTNASIIVALLLTTIGWLWADTLFALGIAIYIFYSAIEIGKESFRHLMDEELDGETQKTILQMALAHPRVLGVHDLRTRQSGQAKFIQLHLELDENLPLIESHAIADAVEHTISKLIPGAEVIVHQDPVGDKN
jgi:ferrous-iron efflux pump FieF